MPRHITWSFGRAWDCKHEVCLRYFQVHVGGGCVTWGGYEIVNGRGLSSVWRRPHCVHWTVTGRDSSQAGGRFNLKSKYKKTGTIGQRYILMVNEGRVQRRTENRWVWSYPTPPPSQVWSFPGSKSNPHFFFQKFDQLGVCAAFVCWTPCWRLFVTFWDRKWCFTDTFPRTLF